MRSHLVPYNTTPLHSSGTSRSCWASRGRRRRSRPARISVADMLEPAERELLKEGRLFAFNRPDTTLNLSSPMRPAIAYYTGQPLRHGRDPRRPCRGHLPRAAVPHHLRGYGVLWAGEPIHWYNPKWRTPGRCGLGSYPRSSPTTSADITLTAASSCSPSVRSVRAAAHPD